MSKDKYDCRETQTILPELLASSAAAALSGQPDGFFSRWLDQLLLRCFDQQYVNARPWCHRLNSPSDTATQGTFSCAVLVRTMARDHTPAPLQALQHSLVTVGSQVASNWSGITRHVQSQAQSGLQQLSHHVHCHIRRQQQASHWPLALAVSGVWCSSAGK